jgi:short-subunit dehydrogenase
VCVAGDITDETVRKRAIEAARDELGGLDILVNNAGVAAHGRFIESDPGRVRPLMELNYFAPIELMRAAIPLLRTGRQPIAVNIGSILGERAAPHKSEYSASKFALHGFSEAVRPELARLGIDVLLVAAGPTETEHFDVLLEEKGKLPWGEPRRRPAAETARVIVRAIEQNRRQIVTDWRSWCWLLLNRLAPGLVGRILRRYG